MTNDPSFDPLLLDRYRAGELAPDERARVEAWLRSHPADAQLLREGPAAALGGTGAGTDAAWQRLSARLDATPVDQLAPRRAAKTAIGAPMRVRPWLRHVAGVAAAALVVVAGTAVWRATRGGSIEAPLGRDVTALLPDGTRVTLAAGSTVRWTGAFGTDTRDLTLTGEGYFDVVHDEQRPFRVRTRDAVAQDVGTRFVIRAWPELPAVEVAVEEGLVALTDTLHTQIAQATVLQAGQRGRLERGAVRVSADADAVLAWTRGELVFDNRPLIEVLPAISRRFDVQLVADPALRDRRLTARFTAQSLQNVLDALALSLSVRVVTSGRSISLTPSSP